MPGLRCCLLMPLLLASTARAQTVLLEWEGPGFRSGFGSSVTGVGDIDGDGTPDLMVGAPDYKDDAGFQGARGFVGVYSGDTGVTLYRYIGSHAQPNAGFSLAAGGDVDGDGVRDVLFAGVENCCYASAVKLHSGRTGKLLYEVQGIWPDTWDLGHRLLGDLDLDDDGFGDFVYTTLAGSQLIATSGADFGTLFEVSGAPGSGVLGSGLASISDLDGDGVSELVVGVVAGGSLPEGQVLVLSGADGSAVYTVPSPAGAGGLGFATDVAGVGDLDGDLLDDFAVAASASSLSAADGRVFVFSGADGALLLELFGSQPGSWFPSALAGPGDLDGDGIPDVAVGASRDSEVLNQGGRVTVFSGADGSVLRVHYGSEVGAHLGSAVAGVGDLDGGGAPDLAIGASSGLPLSNGAGEVSVLASERSAGVYCTAKTNSAGCTPTIWSSGSAAVVASTLTLSAQSLINEQPGVLVWGLHPARAPFGGGVSCVAQIEGRSAQWSGGNPSALFPEPDCSGSFREDWSSASLAAKGLIAGQTVYVQFQYADPADPLGIGLTDALRFDILP